MIKICEIFESMDSATLSSFRDCFMTPNMQESCRKKSNFDKTCSYSIYNSANVSDNDNSVKPGLLNFIGEPFKIQDMCDYAIDKVPYTFASLSNSFKTYKMYCRILNN